MSHFPAAGDQSGMRCREHLRLRLTSRSKEVSCAREQSAASLRESTVPRPLFPVGIDQKLGQVKTWDLYLFLGLFRIAIELTAELQVPINSLWNRKEPVAQDRAQHLNPRCRK
jgi:hypothetical protein